MTTEEKYLSVLTNISPNAPLDLDPLLFSSASAKPVNAVGKGGSFPPSAKLWDRVEDQTTYIGIRVKTPIREPQTVGAYLAAAAVERHIVPVFLSWNGLCGMQQFGFRVERISGATEAECIHCEEQVVRFWNMAIVVDVADVTGMS